MAFPRVFFKNQFKTTTTSDIQQYYGYGVSLAPYIDLEARPQDNQSYDLYSRLQQLGPLNFDFNRGDRVFLTIYDAQGNTEVLEVNAFDTNGEQFGFANGFHKQAWPSGSPVEIRICSQSLEAVRLSAVGEARLREFTQQYNASDFSFQLNCQALGLTYTNFGAGSSTTGARTYVVPDSDHEFSDPFGTYAAHIPDGSTFFVLDALPGAAASIIAPFNGNVTILKPAGKVLRTTGLGARVEILKLTDNLWMVGGDLASA